MAIDNKFGKPICSICYEDLKPIVEDLQVISICGHVFHELCLQQWFEYCSSTKKCTCPVCKQSCKSNDVSRIYFQSIGDQTETLVSQKPKDCEAEDPEVLRCEVKGLEVKVSRLNSALESQGQELKQINEELCLSREHTKKEVALKNEFLREKTYIQQQLHLKSQDLDKLTSECLRLQERNMALAKELAALKLVSDLNLDENEVLKFASLGNGANNKDTIDVLRKSLVIRNRNYIELMAKCNLLGREKTRSCAKLEKAKEKILKLKTRVQELETAGELKDNEVLRSLKALKKTSHENDILNGNVDCSKFSHTTNHISEDFVEQCSVPMSELDGTRSVKGDLSCSTKLENFNSFESLNANHAEEVVGIMAHKKAKNASLIEETSRSSTVVLELSSPHLKHQANVDVIHNPTLSRLNTSHVNNKEVAGHGPHNLPGNLGSRSGINNHNGTAPAAATEEVTLIVDDDDDFEQVQPVLNIRKESPMPVPLSKPGNFKVGAILSDVCFSSGLLGPDGTNRYLGKWCKRGQNKVPMQGSIKNSGDLIAVGADGRGGRIKVLRSANQSSQHGKENLLSAKRLKFGAKTSNVQSPGCLQIEHFFERVSQ
ncbi:hypothetical protein Patl1_00506 [Pistacia atlantica]|uniref:Uncharacterized protein n=1 Tax=Pistacia atlantica TaxID=434234 RepID=A0ACC1CB69_9ROSI|nr:hypothetical protein Patl1_00506 [Pistacia atlantica]